VTENIESQVKKYNKIKCKMYGAIGEYNKSHNYTYEN